MTNQAPKPATVRRHQTVLAARKRELDEREAEIVLRENKLRDVENQIKVLELRIAERQQQIDSLDAKLVESTNKSDLRLQESSKMLTAIHMKIDEAQELYDKLTETCAQETKNLNKIRGDIKEREDYLKQQEKLIEETIERGNDEITSINFEVKQLYLKRDKEMQDSREAEEALQRVRNEIHTHSDRLNDLKDLYASTAANLKHSLAEIQSKIERASDEYKDIISRSQSMVNKLSQKEKELDTRKKVIDDREAKIAEEERVLAGRRRLFSAQQ